MRWHIDGTLYSQQHPSHKGRVLDRAEFDESEHFAGNQNHLELDVISGFIDAKVYLQRHTCITGWKAVSQGCLQITSLYELAVPAQIWPLLSARGNKR